jgi:hypothetical protein
VLGVAPRAGSSRMKALCVAKHGSRRDMSVSRRRRKWVPINFETLSTPRGSNCLVAGAS